MEVIAFEAEFSLLEKHSVPAGDWIVEGYVSTSDLDSQNHIVSAEALQMGAESLRKYDTVLFNHDPDRPIGKVTESAVQEGNKLLARVVISKTEPKIWEQIKDGTLSKFSIRGKILDSEYYNDERTLKQILLIKGMELHEVSLVSVPANPNARSLNWYIEKALEKKDYRQPGESLSDCVSRKTKLNIGHGMSQKQAVAAAYSMCGEAKKTDFHVEDIIDAIWPSVIDIQKDEKNLNSAIKNLESSLSDLKGEDKDQVTAMIRSLQALVGRVYQKDDKGGHIVDKEEVKKEAAPETPVEDEVKKSEDKPQKVELDVSALSSVISQLQDMVKSVTEESKKVETDLADVKKTKEDIDKASGDLAKTINTLNEVLKGIPLRKGESPEKEEDRTKETIVKKQLSEDENFQKANPMNQLHMLIQQATNERGE